MPKITIANTTNEALSACLAEKLSNDVFSDSSNFSNLKTYYTDDQNNASKDVALRDIEDQLEAIQLSYRLSERELDVMSRFREMRHENGFNLSTLSIGRKANKSLEDDTATQLPHSLTEKLLGVNQLQKI